MRLGPSIMRFHVSNASPSWRPWKAEARILVSRARTDWFWSPSTTAIGSRTRRGSSYLARWDMVSPLRVEPRARLGVLALALGAQKPVPAPPGDQRLLDGAAGEARLELGDDGVLMGRAVRRRDRRERAREDRLQDIPEAPGVEGRRRHEVGEVRLAKREGVEGEVAARQEDERADPAVLRYDPVVVREHERGHHRLEPELGRDLLEHLLDQRDVVEAGAEPLEAVYREVEHSPPSFERAGRVSFGEGSTRTVERTGALASAGSAATSDGACTVSSATADDGVASRRNVTAPSKRSQRKNVTPAPAALVRPGAGG